MEPGSTVDKVFSIHELVLMVSAHLSSPDLARCTLVCKDWLRRFEPSLWTNFCPDMDDFTEFMGIHPPVKAALIRNLCHIRSIGDFPIDEDLIAVLGHGLPQQHGESVKDPDTLCTNLRRINLESFYSEHFDIYAQRLDTLLRHNHRLTHLVVNAEILEGANSFETLSTLRHLQHLTVKFFHDVPSDEVLEILQACLPLPELTELRFIDAYVLWDASDNDTAADTHRLETIISEATIARFAQNSTAKKIRLFKFPCAIGETWVPLPLLLLRSSLLDLESCEVSYFSPYVDADEIERVVREHCPNLKHLECRVVRKMDIQPVLAFIRGCSGLQSFTSPYFCDDPDLEPRSLLEELVSRHHATLETFELNDVGQVFSPDLQEILRRCKQLRRFRMMSDSRDDTMSAIVATDIFRRNWNCMELRELGLELNLRPRDTDLFYDMDQKEVIDWFKEFGGIEGQVATNTTKREKVVDEEGERDIYRQLVAMATKRVYNQIGRLERLEELTLDIDRSSFTSQLTGDYASNLTLSKGWLGEMAGLKKLRRLELKADFWSEMGQAEVEFICEHWPLLKEIAFPCDISDIHALPHWQWLLSKRPQLLLVGKREVVESDLFYLDSE